MGILNLIAENRAKGINVFEANITPDDAAVLLAMSKGNRKMRPHLINEYIQLMKDGRWKVGNDAILITILDGLINAHHRLTAIAISGVTVRMLIRVDAQPDEAVALDTGLKRDLIDVQAFDKSLSYINRTNMVIARTAITAGGCSFSDRDVSNEKIATWVKKYYSPIKMVTDDFFEGRDIKKITASAVQASFMLILLNKPEHEDKLRTAARNLIQRTDAEKHNIEFQSDLSEGSNALYALYNFLMKGTVSSGGGTSRKEIFEKTQVFLHYFLRGEDVGKKKVKYDSSWFPCPDVVKFGKDDPILTYKLKTILSPMPAYKEITPLEIGELLVKNGYKSSYLKDAERSLSKKFAKLVKDAPDNKLSFGEFYVMPAENDDVKPVKRGKKATVRVTAYIKIDVK
jgi:hypothetical protein